MIQVSLWRFLSHWLALSNLCKRTLESFGASCGMPDALFARAARAIEESRSLREQHRRDADQYSETVNDLRLAIMDSAMLRSEIKARRDNEKP